jgi:serine/threonine protein kinase
VVGPAARGYSVDVWALGCLLYILLGGYSPYADNDPKMTAGL